MTRRMPGSSSGRSVRAWILLTAGVALAVMGTPTIVEAQVHWRDFVVTVGGSAEAYTGNFSAVTVPIVDSTETANAAVAEVGVSGSLWLLQRERTALQFILDGGVRQAAATGFRLRDYSPREWAGSTSLMLDQAVGSWGQFSARAGIQTRTVADRPPMPLFLQPGFTTASGALGLYVSSVEGVLLDVEVDLESSDYRALDFLPQLDLLDRRGVGLEAGARWGSAESRVRFFGGLRWREYQHQGSFDADDPFRRDRTLRAGLDWTRGGSVDAQLGVEGVLNRSNSNRPEYDAVRVSGLLTMDLPGSLIMNAYALLTWKSYVHETEFARLVPGEEADNASIAYVEVARAFAINLDGAVRLGWTRAETDIGSAYYRRVGLSVRMNYRPRW